MICRTQGLPLAFYDDETQGYSVTFCPQNFTKDADTLEFNAENTLKLDMMNDKLFEIHLQFLAEHPEMNMDSKSRIELKHLGEYF
jgi:hypothetical protein